MTYAKLLGFGFLLASVLMCTLVHFAIGRVFLGRARRNTQEEREVRKRHLQGRFSTTLAWVSGGLQLLFVLTGCILVILPQTPEFLKTWFGW